MKDRRLSPADLVALERLVDAGALIAKPQTGSAKLRKVMAGALAHHHSHIILWLSTKTWSEADAGS